MAWVAHSRTRGRPPALPDEVLEFHRALPDYQPTPLVNVPSLAHDLSLGRLLAKDESWRLGLPAFKSLGVTWAMHRLIESTGSSHEALTFVTATDGNHGRVVARFARIHGHTAEIFIPDGLTPSAIQSIRDEGALVRVVGGSYDHAVDAASAASNKPGHVLIQDTAWSGYEEVPGWIVEGYTTLFREVDEQITSGTVDLVLVPTGVGSLLQSCLHYYRSTHQDSTRVVSVEPESAACVPESLRAGHAVEVATSHTIMTGLNCGTLSMLAWPMVRDYLDGAVTVTDHDAAQAARDLAAEGIDAGPCGGSGLAAARAILTGPRARQRRRHLQITATSTVLVIITEGSAANPVPPNNA